MPPTSEARLLALQELRVRGLVERLDVPAPLIEELERTGLVRHRAGAAPGWSLTPAGRIEQDRLVADELGRTGARGAVEAAYRRFLELNHGFLGLCSAWQLEPDETAATIAALVAVHAAVRPIVDDLAGVLTRFGSYGARFDHALERVQAGDRDWFTKPLVDSYHTVWFELHEDLLSTLGIARGQERTA